jgi:hypothetical protein
MLFCPWPLLLAYLLSAPATFIVTGIPASPLEQTTLIPGGLG